MPLKKKHHLRYGVLTRLFLSYCFLNMSNQSLFSDNVVTILDLLTNLNSKVGFSVTDIIAFNPFFPSAICFVINHYSNFFSWFPVAVGIKLQSYLERLISNKSVPRISRDLVGNSKLSRPSGCLALRQLNPTHKKGP